MSYKVKLEIFEGPLDLLLYLIKKDELNIYDILITRITEQYLEYLSLIEQLDLDVAGEFILMAATLMHIKSKTLLPPDPEGITAEEADPRAELVKRLLEYKAFKEAAESLRGLAGERAKIYNRIGVEPERDESDLSLVDVSLFELLNAFAKVLRGLPKDDLHEIIKDEFTVAEKVHQIFHLLAKRTVVRFSELFKSAKNKSEVITTFLALLELVRLREVRICQDTHFGDIEISRNPKSMEPVNGAENNG